MSEPAGKPVRESQSEYSELALPNDANLFGMLLGAVTRLHPFGRWRTGTRFAGEACDITFGGEDAGARTGTAAIFLTNSATDNRQHLAQRRIQKALIAAIPTPQVGIKPSAKFSRRVSAERAYFRRAPR